MFSCWYVPHLKFVIDSGGPSDQCFCLTDTRDVTCHDPSTTGHSRPGLYWSTCAEGQLLSAGRLTRTCLCLSPGSWHVNRWHTQSSAASCGTRDASWTGFVLAAHPPACYLGWLMNNSETERGLSAAYFVVMLLGFRDAEEGRGWECAADSDRAGFLRSVMETGVNPNVTKTEREIVVIWTVKPWMRAVLFQWYHLHISVVQVNYQPVRTLTLFWQILFHVLLSCPSWLLVSSAGSSSIKTWWTFLKVQRTNPSFLGGQTELTTAQITAGCLSDTWCQTCNLICLLWLI